MSRQTAGPDGQPDMTVVVNDRGQYSLWAVGRPVPPGWTAVGTDGTTAECLAHIERVWLDVLPRDARRGAVGSATPAAPPIGAGRV